MHGDGVQTAAAGAGLADRHRQPRFKLVDGLAGNGHGGVVASPAVVAKHGGDARLVAVLASEMLGELDAGLAAQPEPLLEQQHGERDRAALRGVEMVGDALDPLELVRGEPEAARPGRGHTRTVARHP